MLKIWRKKKKKSSKGGFLVLTNILPFLPWSATVRTGWYRSLRNALNLLVIAFIPYSLIFIEVTELCRYKVVCFFCCIWPVVWWWMVLVWKKEWNVRREKGWKCGRKKNRILWEWRGRWLKCELVIKPANELEALSFRHENKEKD